MKQLYNDPRNHVKPKEQIAQLLGKETGTMINSVADKTADRIATILQEGSNELQPVKDQNDRLAGSTKLSIEKQQEEAQQQMEEAKKKIKETEDRLK